MTSLFNKYKILIFSIVAAGIFLVSKNNGMFWDNVLFASKMGNHLYNNSIFDWTLPNEFDPGHPPFLGFLLAIFWKILGHKLWVSHLLIFPFIVGVFYQIFKFVSYFIESKKSQIFAFLLIIIDPTLSTQFVLVNPEIIFIFFFFVAINGILFNKKALKYIGLFFLSIVTFRSMMLFGGVLLFDILNKIYIKKEKLKTVLNFRFILFYILAGMPGIVFVAWRLLTKGWLQTHPESPWADLWQIATPKIFFKNSIVLIHKYLDFGRVFIILFLIVSLFLFGKKIITSTKNKQLLLLSITSVIFIIATALISTNFFGHRYFIVSFCGLNLLAFSILQNYNSKKKLIYSLLFIGLITGNLWIYPKKIAQGWDATLAHIPYHSLRLDAINYLNNQKIDISEVATFFPNRSSLELVDFNKDTRSFTEFTGTNKYVFYSTVYNVSDENLDLLDENYTILKEFKNFNITITLYTFNKK